jgi:DUF4097 and DUF4098 domain-containing protein YvlB
MPEEKWLVEDEKIIDLGPITSLKVSLVAGQVDVIGHDEPTTRVEVHSVRGKGLKVVRDGDRLLVDHPQLNWDNFIEVFKSFRGTASADVSIMVPRAVALKLGVVSANALVSGLTENATLSTVSGELAVDSMRADVRLNSVSGEIAVSNHSGDVSLNTVSGEVTASGDIQRFAGDTVSGSVFLDLRGSSDEVRVNTVSGSVTTRLAPGAAAQYKINTVGGRIHLDDSDISGTRGTFTGRYGSLEQTWADIKVNTVGGDISVLHAVKA